jgi:putative SOS response-associated peptidase YedK
MCGRFTLTADINTLQQTFPWVNVPPGMAPRFNIAPSQPVAVVANDGLNKLDFFVWGLIPSWAKDPTIGSRMINARAETLAEKPSFRNAFRRRRCLILADGFFEWQKIEESGSRIRKQPMYIHLADGRPFAFAGLWENWNSPDGSNILSCTIITTEPNELMASIHNRMPVILPEESYTDWLQPGETNAASLSKLLVPFPPERMNAYPVSTVVNSPANDLPATIQPV